MRLKRKFTAFIVLFTFMFLSMSMVVTAVDRDYTPSLSSFEKQNVYTLGKFTDVDESAWYAPEVAKAYEYGLMSGQANNKFGVTNNMSLAEVITVAARIDSIFYTGEADFPQSVVWYQTYVDYALKNGILSTPYLDYTVPATRAQFVEILSKALPADILNEINLVDDKVIPDVNLNANYYDAVYLFYRAGIVTGTNVDGSFSPDQTISRPEVAAIVVRMVDIASRQSITLVGEY